MNDKVEVKILEWLGLNYETVILRQDFTEVFGSAGSHELEDMEGEYHLISLVNGIIVVFSLEKIITEIEIISNQEKLQTLQEDFHTYKKNIPFGISFPMTREQIHNLLGTPKQSGEDRNIPILGHCPSWDLYEYHNQNVELFIQYSQNQTSILSITIRVPESKHLAY